MGPAPAMVSKERSFSAPVASRNSSSLSPRSISSAAPVWPSVPRASGGSGTAPRRRGVRLARALDLDRVLAGAGQGAGVLRRGPPRRRPCRARRSTRPRTGPDRPSRACPAARPARRSSSSAGASVTSLPSHARAAPAPTLRGSRNSRAAPSANRNALAERQGRADDVAAADVEQPGDGGGRGQHRRVDRPWSASALPMRARLATSFSPAYSSRCGTTGAVGSGGRPGPRPRPAGWR